MFNLSASFLATDIKQLPLLSNIQGVEAIVFNREDLQENTWATIWDNIEIACKVYNPNYVTFHFPVNESDYIDDIFVRNRLKESFEMASSMGLAGIVVHSNRIRKINQWKDVNLKDERKKVIDVLLNICGNSNEKTWLALENMPIMDNYGIEIDPLFSFPADFADLLKTPIGIVWDQCHYSNTLSNMQELFDEKQDKEWYPNIEHAQLQDFILIDDKIKHWHFSAFLGIANPQTGQTCREGVLPTISTMGESFYYKVLKIMHNIYKKQLIVLEIQEDDYTKRNYLNEMITWIREKENSFLFEKV